MTGPWPASAETAASAQKAAQPAKVLLVDDRDANLVALNGLLQGEGVELHQALSGREALELLLVHDFALAVIDVQMPEMTGFELASLMRGAARTRNIPIIFITAGAHDAQHRFRGYEAGAVDFLYKPIEPDVLRFKTAVFLELYRTRQEITRQRDALRISERRLEQELRSSRRLHDLSTKLIQAEDPAALHEQILGAVLDVTEADFATLHMLSVPGEESSGLVLLAQCGLSPELSADVQRVRALLEWPCTRALQSGKRIASADVGEGGQGVRAFQSTPLTSREGKLLGVISSGWRRPHQLQDFECRCLDIVGRQAADFLERAANLRALRQGLEQLRFMAESMPQKIFRATPAGEVEYVNEKWLEYTGAGRTDLLGSGWTRWVHPDDLEMSLERWRAALETNSPLELEHRFRRADGAYRWHLTRANALCDSSGQCLMWIGSNTDIQMQKQTELELRRFNEDLSHFAYAASHDLQEPLRVVSCYSELLLKAIGDDAPRGTEVYAAFIKDGTRRMRDLLTDLLSYTQVAKGSPDPEEGADLGVAAALAVENLRTAIDESQAIVDIGKLPVVVGHEMHYVQLFQNLIGNSLKYRSTDTPRIVIGAVRAHEEWQISVADNGIGIAGEFHQKIFGVFKRLHGKSIPGTGIGLSICQRIVERYGGRIWVESEPGVGATFCFTAPEPPPKRTRTE